MTGEMVVLTPEQRRIVDVVVVDHCRIRKWSLHARNVRTNHVHVVVTAPIDPKVVREQLKAWASQRLSDQSGLRGTGKDGKRRWWTEKGDIEWVRDEEHLAQVIRYVLELQ
jgi:REP element-mobilizing transposase RayT